MARREIKSIMCPSCQGTGVKPNIAVGLGQGGLVPAYADQQCKRCKGDGVLTEGEENQYSKTIKKQQSPIFLPYANEYMISDDAFLPKCVIKWLDKYIFGKESE